MEIENLLKSNANLEDYLREYGDNPEFIFQYYLQDINRITTNYYSYSSSLKDSDKFKLIYKAINEANYNSMIILVNDISNKYSLSDYVTNECDKVYDVIIDLCKNDKISVEALPAKSLMLRRDPIFFIQKDITLLNSLCRLKNEEVIKILDYLRSQNYTFTKQDSLFLRYSVFDNMDCFIYFTNNCNYSDDINIGGVINSMTKEEVLALYAKIINGKQDTKLLKEIYNKLNYENYDYNTIIKNHDLYLDDDLNKRDKITDFLKELKEKDFKGNVILKMDRVNMEYINQIYAIIGDKLKISPVIHQVVNDKTHEEGIVDIPYYDVSYIKQSEEKLDLYASMVKDTKDLDGEIKSLSPLEKYVAAYILTTKFAPYREEDKNDPSYASRAVYEFINSTTNTKIVCAGYVHLLREILDRMGINDTIDWVVAAESEDKDSLYRDHARMMIHLQDPKYDIDGVYMADPTWDDHDITKKSMKHMLMSHDELLEIDSDLSLAKLRADETLIMDRELGINNSHELFRKPIPKDVIIKANLAVEHFLDKNMKMVKDNQYDLLEYVDMAEHLKFYDVYQNNREAILARLEKMSVNEIKYNYPDLITVFCNDLLSITENKLKDMGISSKPVITSTNKNEECKVLLGYKYRYATEYFPNANLSLDDVYKIKEMVPLTRINPQMSEARFYVQMDSNKPINEQYDEIIAKLSELDSVCQNITSNNIENGVKYK